MPPVASELDVAGVGAGDTVGAGEIDGAVEIEVLAGEDGGAEFVVFVKGGGVKSWPLQEMVRLFESSIVNVAVGGERKVEGQWRAKWRKKWCAREVRREK